ncbi:MAG: hypothetical protein LBC89_06545 [Bacteroidales bacterium]|jgi:hypothetical protein|nr:hypothetical protein [Bacteroidales bacterium]
MAVVVLLLFDNHIPNDYSKFSRRSTDSGSTFKLTDDYFEEIRQGSTFSQWHLQHCRRRFSDGCFGHFGSKMFYA